MKFKSVALVLALIMVLMCGCQKTEQNTSSSSSSATSSVKEKDENEAKLNEECEEKHISIACSITDSFCPYSASTRLNREIGTLLYDSLVILDNTFTPNKSLAEDIKISGSTVTVTIKDTVFTDGSSLTADDVVYCARKAMKSGTRYDDALKDVSSVSAASSKTVVFKLKKQDPYFENQLDFPIYKRNSDKKISSDNIQIPPIGSGRYVMNKEKTVLKANSDFHGGKPRLEKIHLINTPDEDALSHNMEVGNINYYYSNLADCELPSVRGGYKNVNLNNLVFLGANMHGGVMKNVNMRQVISAALDRERISEEAYYQNAIAATGVFNPKWSKTGQEIITNETKPNSNIYVALLNEMGYNDKDNSGYYVNSEGNCLTVKIIYYKGNEWRTNAAKLIRAQLKTAGIKANLEALSWKDYKNSLKKGYYDLYVGEVKLSNNMDISELVIKNGSLAYGIDYSGNSASKKKKNFAGATAAAVDKFYSGKGKLADITAAFSNELPIIPICYRTGIVSHALGITGATPTISDVYNGIENITIK